MWIIYLNVSRSRTRCVISLGRHPSKEDNPFDFCFCFCKLSSGVTKPTKRSSITYHSMTTPCISFSHWLFSSWRWDLSVCLCTLRGNNQKRASQKVRCEQLHACIPSFLVWDACIHEWYTIDARVGGSPNFSHSFFYTRVSVTMTNGKQSLRKPLLNFQQNFLHPLV